MNKDDVEKLYASIERDAQQIMKDAADGNKKAEGVMTYHRLCVVSADVPTVALLSAAYKDYCDQKKQDS